MATANSTSKSIIRAGAYGRKSTDGQDSSGKKRQENSLEQQQVEIAKLKPADDGVYEIVRSYEDAGKSGWKRGAQRPDFTQMLSDCQRWRDLEAILVDDIDRFSRATVGEVWSDIQSLKSAGVRYIHAANQGVYNLGNDGDIGTILKLTVEIWSANQFSSKLGRRIALSRRERAKNGKRSGGKPPYGLLNDGEGGLIPGDAQEIETVRRIFDLFANRHNSFHKIAAILNHEGVPSPRGSVWYRGTVSTVLRQVAYVGRFEAFKQSCGRFYSIQSNGEVAESNGAESTKHAPVFVRQDAYAPIVDSKLFDKAQRRLATFKAGRKPRTNGYALSRILVCDHCGGPMTASLRNGKDVFYRCIRRANRKPCGNYAILEKRILPAVLTILDQEISGLLAESLVPKQPTVETPPSQRQKIERLEAQLQHLSEEVTEFKSKSARLRCDAKILEVESELERLRAEQALPADSEAEAAALQQLTVWLQESQKNLARVAVPAGGTLAEAAAPGTVSLVYDFKKDSLSLAETTTVNLDRRALNEALHQLGTEIRLRFRSERRSRQMRNFLDRGRFRLGQRSGELALNVMCRLGRGRAIRVKNTPARSAWAWHDQCPKRDVTAGCYGFGIVPGRKTGKIKR